MVNCNPSGITKSKDPARQKTIRPLPLEKMKYIDGVLQLHMSHVHIYINMFRWVKQAICLFTIHVFSSDILQEKWKVTTADKTIRKKLTQKCTDYFSDTNISGSLNCIMTSCLLQDVIYYIGLQDL